MQLDPDRFRGCLLGLAVGDAVGTTVEFQVRGSFPRVVDMVGGGPFKLLPGQWTDDTSMALCLAMSLISCRSFDPVDQMNRYWDWYQNGYLSSTGKCFDIGNTISYALHQYQRTGDPFSGSTAPVMAGNGSLMRLAPIPMYYFPDLDQILHFAGESSRTTHGAQECIDACRLFAEMLYRALAGMSKENILLHGTGQPGSSILKEIAAGGYRQKNISQIKGSGYVSESLEAALWCFYRTSTFEAAVLQAANLGDDADTTAAICGQIAGAHYGEANIPVNWLDRLYMRFEISYIAEQLSEIGA